MRAQSRATPKAAPPGHALQNNQNGYFANPTWLAYTICV